jgi:Ca2+-binding EF-hand superfamily protein
MPVSGLSSSQMQDYRNAAQRLVATYDRNGDGAIDRDEAQQQIRTGSDSYSLTNRISNDYVERTTIFQDNFTRLSAGDIAAADRNGDGLVTADELVNAYLERKDSNHNGNLSWWEKLSTSIGGMRDMFQNNTSVETNRITTMEFDPIYNPPVVVVVDPYSPGPTPPRPNYRPAPPDVSNPYRPTPPSVGGRPTPPSVRPTPPRVH